MVSSRNRRSRVATGDYESQQLVASRNGDLGSSWSGYEWSCAGCESQRDSQSWSRLVLLWFRVVTTRFRLAIWVATVWRVCVTGFHKSCIDLSVISANSLVSLVTRSINKILNKSIAWYRSNRTIATQIHKNPNYNMHEQPTIHRQTNIQVNPMHTIADYLFIR